MVKQQLVRFLRGALPVAAVSAVLAVSVLHVSWDTRSDSPAPPVAAETAPAAATSTAPPPLTLSPQELIAQGHTAEESYTAFVIQQQTDVPAVTLLDDRAAGNTWEQILTNRAPDTPLVLPSTVAVTGSAIDGAVVDALVEQGYEHDDVLAAASLARQFGKTTEAVLSMKTALGGTGTWPQVHTQLLQEVNATARPARTVADYMAGRTTTPSGLTRPDVENYVAQGLTVRDIAQAELLRRPLQATVPDLLARRKAGVAWMTMVNERRAVDPNALQPTGVVFTQAYSRMPSLTPDQVSAYAAQNVSQADMLKAIDLAGRRATTPTVVLDAFVRAGNSWSGVNIPPGSTGTEPASPTPAGGM